jgi:hypothetical protein
MLTFQQQEEIVEPWTASILLMLGWLHPPIINSIVVFVDKMVVEIKGR